MLVHIHQDSKRFDEICSWCSLPPKLIGENVFFTAFDPAYADDVLRFITAEDVALGLGDHLYKALTRQEEEENLSRWKCNSEDGYSMFVWDIEDRKLIGTCCLFDIHPISRSSEVSVVIGDGTYRRRGYATEVLELLLSFAFDTLNLHSVRLEVFEYNDGAIECYRKLGFKETGRHRDARYAQSRYWDEILMDILEDEWRRLQKKTGN